MPKNDDLTKRVKAWRSPRLPAEMAKNVAADAKAKPMKDIIAEKAAEVQAMDTGNHKKTWQSWKTEDAEQKLQEAEAAKKALREKEEKEAAEQAKEAALEVAVLTPRSQLRWRRQTTPEGEERSHSPERKQVIAEREAMTATKGVASKAKKIVFDAGASVFGRFGALKARGLDAIKFAKDSSSKTSKGIAVRVAAGKANIGARVSDVKARAVEVVAGIKETTYGLATKVVTNSALARGYIVDKLSVAKGTVAKLTACRAVARSYVVDTLSGAKGRVANRIEGTNARVVERVTYLIEDSKAKVKSTVTTASAKASELNIKVKDVAADPKTKTAAAGAASGAVALGATGGAVGLASGSFIGAAVGLVPAIFTFGLSIPIGAAIGGSAGLCVGTAVGGTTGLVAGGAAGYKKDSISSGTKKVFAQAGEGLRYTKDTAGASRQYVLKQVNSSASYLRARVQRISGTGGTETLPSESD